jgi:hypothetical protein
MLVMSGVAFAPFRAREVGGVEPPHLGEDGCVVRSDARKDFVSMEFRSLRFAATIICATCRRFQLLATAAACPVGLRVKFASVRRGRAQYAAAPFSLFKGISGPPVQAATTCNKPPRRRGASDRTVRHWAVYAHDWNYPPRRSEIERGGLFTADSGAARVSCAAWRPWQRQRAWRGGRRSAAAARSREPKNIRVVMPIVVPLRALEMPPE